MIITSNATAETPPPPVIWIERIITRDASGDERWWSSLAEIREAYPGVTLE